MKEGVKSAVVFDGGLPEFVSSTRMCIVPNTVPDLHQRCHRGKWKLDTGMWYIIYVLLQTSWKVS